MTGKHLYIIQNQTTGDFKVGRSNNPKERIKSLQTGCKDKLSLILIKEGQGTREKYIHQEMKRFHISGEWFKYIGLPELPIDIYESINLDIANNIK